MQYENPITAGKKATAKVKVFSKAGQTQGQGHRVKNHGIN